MHLSTKWADFLGKDCKKVKLQVNTIRPWPSVHDKHTRPYKLSHGHLTKKLISHALQI